MGIFDSVLGKYEKASSGGLFSSNSAFRQETNVFAAPLPATAHIEALKKQGFKTGRRGPGGGGDSDDDEGRGSDSSDYDSDSDKKPKKKGGKKDELMKSAKREKESVEEAYEAAAAVMADDGRGVGGKKSKKGAAAAAAAAAGSSKKKRKKSDDDDDDSDDGSDVEEEAGGDSDSSDADDDEQKNKKEEDASTKNKKLEKVKGAAGSAAPAGKPADTALPRTIFVGNLPVTIKPKSLKTLFSKFGDVESARLRSVPVDAEGKMPRGGKVITGKLVQDRNSTNAYVVFRDEAAAAKAVEMNMREVEGRHVRVDRAAAPSAHANEAKAKANATAGSTAGGGEVAYDHTRSLFLGNLAYNVDEEDIIRIFHRSKDYPELSGSVEAVRVVRDRMTNLGKGIAYVLFKKSGDARTALLLDGAKLGDRAVRVTRASKNRAAAAAEAEKKKKLAQSGSRRGRGVTDGGGERGPQGAARRLKLEDDSRLGGGGGAAWEGSRSRPGGKRQKTAHGAPAGGGRGGGPGGGRVGTKAKATRGSKRPAVAARKAKARAAASGGGGGKGKGKGK